MSNKSLETKVVVGLHAETVSKPGATLEVKVITIPQPIKEAIGQSLHLAQEAQAKNVRKR